VGTSADGVWGSRLFCGVQAATLTITTAPNPPSGARLTLLASALTQLHADAVGAVVVAVYITSLFVVAEVVFRIWSLPVEYTRKGTHVGAGLIVFAFPWLLEHTLTVTILAVSFGGILLGGRITGLLSSIHNVERRTSGAYYYPLAVLGVWLLSHGDPLLFCVPLAIMAIADTGAAIVGQRAGETTYTVMDGTRSIEGSMAFFGLAFTIVLIASAVAGQPVWPATLLVALVVAALTTAIESVSVRGSDNVGIPYAAWLALEHTERLGLEALGDWTLGMVFGVLLLLLTWTRARLDVAGGVMVFVVATLTYALGGWAWFLPILAVYGGFLIARTPDATTLERVFPTTASTVVVVLLYAHTDRQDLYVMYLTTVAASGAMGGLLIATARRWPRTLLGVAGALVPLVIAKAIQPDAHFFAPLAGATAAFAALYLFQHVNAVGRRLAISLGIAVVVWAITVSIAAR
jgi:phytol kinase